MTIKYILYARKSSESEDRQMASLEDQVSEMERVAKINNITVGEVITESKSAKEPGRPKFNLMLKKIENGEAQGILCWKLNRLARNPVDGGQISWLLQRNIIQHIQTYSKEYRPSDNVLMMQVEFGMANQFVNDLSIDVKRGMRRKAERGWYPNTKQPIGYLHNPLRNNSNLEEITIDEIRFPIIKKLWALILTGNYSVADIKRESATMGLLNNNGKVYSINTFHNLFANKFYYGYFDWKDENGDVKTYKGKHKPMITDSEFIKVQKLLKSKSVNTRENIVYFPYKSIARCKGCNGKVTAERKYQLRCVNCKTKFSAITKEKCPKCSLLISEMKKPIELHKIYYHCSRRNGKCSEGSVELKAIESEILKEMNKIKISEEAYNFLIDELGAVNLDNHLDIDVQAQIKKRISELNNRLSGLVDMRADGELSVDEYNLKKADLNKMISMLKNKEHLYNQKNTMYQNLVKKYCKTAFNAANTFELSKKIPKNKIVSNFCSNLILGTKYVDISTKKALITIKDCANSYDCQNGLFEPEKSLTKHNQNGDFDPLSSVVLT
ncbi:MAG: recombinase family protein, partial [Ignavibacteria bacterium]|nr:recombinase family protein [Ignavibacteria bacterium]